MPEQSLHSAIDQARDNGVSDERIAEILAEAAEALREGVT